MTDIKPFDITWGEATLHATPSEIPGEDGEGIWKNLLIVAKNPDTSTGFRLTISQAARLRVWLGQYIAKSNEDRGIENKKPPIKQKNIEINNLHCEIKALKAELEEVKKKAQAVKKPEPKVDDAQLRVLRAKVSDLEANLEARDAWIQKAKKYIAAGRADEKP